MRFSRIDIKNYRQYKELSFNFSNNGKHDLHIIVADNGIGKTNLLNAITWCLYNEEPHLGSTSNSLTKLNTKVREEHLAAQQPNATVRVTLYAEDGADKLIFQRKMNVKVKSNFEEKSELIIKKINKAMPDARILSGEDAAVFVDRYMPRRLKKYFYFDGEQLDRYFISEKNLDIKQSVHTISQVETLTRVKNNLNNIIKTRRMEAAKHSPDIQGIIGDIDNLDSNIHDLTKAIQNIESEIQKSQSVIKLNTERLSGQPDINKLQNEQRRLLDKKIRLELEEQNAYNELFSFLERMNVSLYFYDYAKKVLAIIKEKRDQNALPPNVDKSMLKAILKDNNKVCPICGQYLTDDAISYIETVLSKIKVSSETSNLLMFICNEMEATIESAKSYKNNKDKKIRVLSNVQKDLEQCGNDLQKVSDDIGGIADANQLKQWYDEIKRHQGILGINQQKIAGKKIALSNETNKMKILEDKRDKAIEQQQELKKINSQIVFLKKAIDIIESVEKEMMDEVRKEMEISTMNYFNDLMWKKGVYNHISLDDDYRLELYHNNGDSCLGSCSAAERSLLALAFTLALHEVSGFDALLFIDTPVARVSGENRQNFANVLKKVSEHKQLIMAFTPDEYSSNISDIFTPIAADMPVRLKMNQTNDITSI